MINERAFRLQFLGSAIRVDERQFPTVHRLYTEAGTTLDVRQLPELYVTNSPIWNAVTIGMDKPFIVVNSALLKGMDEEELRFILGHELGHAQSGHALYQSLLFWLMRLTGAVNWMPIGALGHPRDHRRPARVVPQGRALRRPGRPARGPGPGGRAARADEAGQRRSARRARHHRVPRPGNGVRELPATCATAC